MTYYEKEKMNRRGYWELQILNEKGNWDAIESNDPKNFNHFFATRLLAENHKDVLNIPNAIYRIVEG